MDIIQRHQVTDCLFTIQRGLADQEQAQAALDEVVRYLMSLEQALDTLDGWKAVTR